MARFARETLRNPTIAVVVDASGATDGDDTIVEELVPPVREPILGLGGDDTLTIYGVSPALLATGDFGDIDIDNETEADTFVFGDDTIVAAISDGGFDTDTGVIVAGDTLHVSMTPDLGTSITLSSGDDTLLSLNEAVQLAGDFEILTVTSLTTATVLVRMGDDVLIAQSGGYLSGDNLLTYLNFQDEFNVKTVVLGDDTLVGGDVAVGDTQELTITTISDYRHAVANVMMGDDVLSGGVMMIGDTQVLIFSSDWAISDMNLWMGDDRIIGSGQSEWLIGDVEVIRLFWSDSMLDRGLDNLDLDFGDDTLISSSANETLVGDYVRVLDEHRFDQLDLDAVMADFITGADTFIFEGDFGKDKIRDFEAGHDHIILSDIAYEDIDQVGVEYDDETGDLILDFTDLGGGTITIRDGGDVTINDFTFA